MGQSCNLKEPCESIALEQNELHEDSLAFFGALSGDLNQQLPRSASRASRALIFARCSNHLLDEVFVRHEQLGTGTYGVVHRAVSRQSEDAAAGFQAAIKTFSRPSQLGRDADAHQMWRVRCGVFHEERMVLAGLEHPHMTQLLGSFLEEAALHLVLEICDGGDLFGLIKDGTHFSEMRAQHIFWQMLSVMNYLHRSYVIHRDLKPENWLLLRRDSDAIKLCDFGSAVQLSAMRPRTWQLGGTVVYQAPEIHLGRGGGASADDWGLGAILYTMLVGNHPFKQGMQSDQVCVDQICQGAFNREHVHWVALSSEVRYLIEQFLIVEENERMSSTEAFSNDWVALGAPDGHSKGVLRLSAAKAFQLAKIVSLFDDIQRLVLAVCARLPSKAISSVQRSVTKEDCPIPWYSLFVHLDRDCDGRLSKAELRDGLAQLMGPSMQDDEVIDALDVDSNGFIDWAEWCMLALLEALSSDTSLIEISEPWRSAHRLLDGPTGDGLISWRDIAPLPGPLGDSCRDGDSSNIVRWTSGRTDDGAVGLTVSDLQNMFSSIGPLPELVIM